MSKYSPLSAVYRFGHTLLLTVVHSKITTFPRTSCTDPNDEVSPGPSPAPTSSGFKGLCKGETMKLRTSKTRLLSSLQTFYRSRTSSDPPCDTTSDVGSHPRHAGVPLTERLLVDPEEGDSFSGGWWEYGLPWYRGEGVGEESKRVPSGRRRSVCGRRCCSWDRRGHSTCSSSCPRSRRSGTRS